MASNGNGPTLLIGTRKGLWQVRSNADRSKWTVDGPQYLGHIFSHVVQDPRDRRSILAAVSTGHLGPTMLRSEDGGQTWKEASAPPAFAKGDRLERSLTRAFWLTPGHPSEPGVWYVGGTPQALFRTEDGGDTWAPVTGWNDHPMWETWCEWPEQQTPDGSMLHSVTIDPRDPSHMYVGLSGGGVFETTDGTDWHPFNKNVSAAFFPGADPYPEFGQDPHCMRIHPANPDRLYQQNHCGIYRIDRPSDEWVRIGDNMPREVGDIGFPVELHPRDPDTVWVFPMDGTDVWPRTSPDGRPAVYKTSDAGETWTRQDDGLPERGWYTVKRQAMTTDANDPVGVYFGTTSGELWASTNEGEEWTCITQHLPEIFSVEVAEPA
jgi:photosystem II stability/assembly factor-like uncharacterized protein